MSLTHQIYKQEPNMTAAKLEYRCQSLGISTPHDTHITPSQWQGTLDNQWQAEKLDACSEFVTLTLRRSEVETIISYSEASSNDDWVQAINHIRENYTK